VDSDAIAIAVAAKKSKRLQYLRYVFDEGMSFLIRRNLAFRDLHVYLIGIVRSRKRQRWSVYYCIEIAREEEILCISLRRRISLNYRNRKI
jgi:hypothetical protein